MNFEIFSLSLDDISVEVGRYKEKKIHENENENQLIFFSFFLSFFLYYIIIQIFDIIGFIK